MSNEITAGLYVAGFLIAVAAMVTLTAFYPLYVMGAAFIAGLGFFVQLLYKAILTVLKDQGHGPRT